MTAPLDHFLARHQTLSRRYFLGWGAAGVAALSRLPLLAAGPLSDGPLDNGPTGDGRLQRAIDQLESYLTPPEEFRDVSRGNPKPHTLPAEKKRQVGLTRDTWHLEVISDEENPARIRSPMTAADGTALDFAALMELAKQHAVRFAKVMTCLNIGCPLGTGIWEGVPLREVLWLTQPRDQLRRVFYYGYHNDDPQQMFRSSLSVGRVLEDPFDLPPVILCYKLNGQWLNSQRGGPVRVVVPEAYGFKSIKWLSHVILSNISHANDTYAKANNDVDSPLKTFAATLSVPENVKTGEPIAVTGYAQVGISGLSKVQVWMHNDDKPLPENDRWFSQASWREAEILGPPDQWGGGLPDGRIPSPTLGFDARTGQPERWPMRLAKVHWAVLLPGLPKGAYTLRCRTIDEKGQAQPLPRPMRKSGHSAIEQIPIVVG